MTSCLSYYVFIRWVGWIISEWVALRSILNSNIQTTIHHQQVTSDLCWLPNIRERDNFILSRGIIPNRVNNVKKRHGIRAAGIRAVKEIGKRIMTPAADYSGS